MAIQCWMCSEILVEDKELAEVQAAAPPVTLRRRAIPVRSGCCPDCLGLIGGKVLHLRAAQHEVTAA